MVWKPQLAKRGEGGRIEARAARGSRGSRAERGAGGRRPADLLHRQVGGDVGGVETERRRDRGRARAARELHRRRGEPRQLAPARLRLEGRPAPRPRRARATSAAGRSRSRCSRITHAVPSVGCPAKGSSSAGVKMRTLTPRAVPSEVTKVVSEKPNSRAMRCIAPVSRSAASRTTASVLPAWSCSAKTSTMWKRCGMRGGILQPDGETRRRIHDGCARGRARARGRGAGLRAVGSGRARRLGRGRGEGRAARRATGCAR